MLENKYQETEDPRKAKVKEIGHSHQLLVMPLPVWSTGIAGTRNQNQEDVLVRLHLPGHGMMFRYLHETKETEVTSFHVLPQRIVSSDSQSRNVTNWYEDPDETQESNLDLQIVVHRAQRTNLPVEDATPVESLVVTPISIRPIDLHHHAEVRHHHLL